MSNDASNSFHSLLTELRNGLLPFCATDYRNKHFNRDQYILILIPEILNLKKGLKVCLEGKMIIEKIITGKYATIVKYSLTFLKIIINRIGVPGT